MASFSPATLVSSATSSAGVLPNTGVMLVGATGAPVYSLAAPYRGAQKTFIQITTSSGLKQILVNSSDVSTAITLGATGGKTTITLTAVDQCISLIGTSATNWVISGNVGTVDAS